MKKFVITAIFDVKKETKGKKATPEMLKRYLEEGLIPLKQDIDLNLFRERVLLNIESVKLEVIEV